MHLHRSSLSGANLERPSTWKTISPLLHQTSTPGKFSSATFSWNASPEDATTLAWCLGEIFHARSANNLYAIFRAKSNDDEHERFFPTQQHRQHPLTIRKHTQEQKKQIGKVQVQNGFSIPWREWKRGRNLCRTTQTLVTNSWVSKLKVGEIIGWNYSVGWTFKGEILPSRRRSVDLLRRNYVMSESGSPLYNSAKITGFNVQNSVFGTHFRV